MRTAPNSLHRMLQNRPAGPELPRGRLGAAATAITVLSSVLTPAVWAAPALGEVPDTTPEVEIRLSDPHPTPQERFVLEVELRWKGEPDALLPHPPSLSKPEGLEIGSVEASTRSDGAEDGESVTLYRLHLAANTPGSYALDPVEIRWTPRGESQLRRRVLEGPTVQVRSPLTQGMASPTGRPGGGTAAAALVGLLAFALLILGWWRGGLTGQATREQAARRSRSELERLEELLRQARKLRQDGMPRDAVEVLVRIQQELDGKELLPRVRLEEIRYGSGPPAPPELDRLERSVARDLADRRPAPSPAVSGRSSARAAPRG